MYIYDSAYPNPANTNAPLAPGVIPQLGHFANLNMARETLRRVRARPLAIDRVYLGGGGNVGHMNACRPMTISWLRQAAVALVSVRSQVAQGSPPQAAMAPLRALCPGGWREVRE